MGLTLARVRRGFAEPPRDNRPAGQRTEAHTSRPQAAPGFKNASTALRYEVGKNARGDLATTARQQPSG